MTAPATKEVIACMGGWCVHRHHCAHHYSDSKLIAERLCPKGNPQPVEFMPVVRGDELPAPLRGGALKVF